MLSITIKADLPFLSISELVQRASALDSLAERVSRRLAKLQEEIKRMQDNLTGAFRSDAAVHAQVKRLTDGKFLAAQPFIAQAKADLDAAFKQAGALVNEVLDQKQFYDSPVKLASRLIGDAQRLAYLQDLAHVGPLALANLAQLAVSTKNKALGSAIVERLAAMPTKEKPVRARELAKVVFADDWAKVQEAFTIAENRFQQITVLYRSFSQHRVNAVQKVELGLNRQRETGILKEVIADEKVKQNES